MLDVSNLVLAKEKADSPKIEKMVLNEKQKLLIGTWKHESAENGDAFLKKIGIGIFLRQVAKIQSPLIRLTYDENSQIWHLYIESAFRNHDYPFKIDEKYKLNTIDGRKFDCITHLDENGVQTDIQSIAEEEPKNIPSIVKRWVDDKGQLIITEECDGVVAKRTFTRVDDKE